MVREHMNAVSRLQMHHIESSLVEVEHRSKPALCDESLQLLIPIQPATIEGCRLYVQADERNAPLDAIHFIIAEMGLDLVNIEFANHVSESLQPVELCERLPNTAFVENLRVCHARRQDTLVVRRYMRMCESVLDRLMHLYESPRRKLRRSKEADQPLDGINHGVGTARDVTCEM